MIMFTLTQIGALDGKVYGKVPKGKQVHQEMRANLAN